MEGGSGWEWEWGGGNDPAQPLGDFCVSSSQQEQEDAGAGRREGTHLQDERWHPLVHPHGVQLWEAGLG